MSGLTSREVEASSSGLLWSSFWAALEGTEVEEDEDVWRRPAEAHAEVHT